MKVRGARGCGCQKRHGLKLICTTGRESPPRERKLLPPQLHHGPLCRAAAKALDCRVGSGSTPPKPHFPPSLGSAQAATGGSSRQQSRSSSCSDRQLLLRPAGQPLRRAASAATDSSEEQQQPRLLRLAVVAATGCPARLWQQASKASQPQRACLPPPPLAPTDTIPNISAELSDSHVELHTGRHHCAVRNRRDE